MISIYWATIHRYVSWPKGRKEHCKGRENEDLKQQQTGHDRIFWRASNSRQASVPPDTKLKLHFCSDSPKDLEFLGPSSVSGRLHDIEHRQWWEHESRIFGIPPTTVNALTQHGLEISNLGQVEPSTTPLYSCNSYDQISSKKLTWIHASICKYVYIYMYIDISKYNVIKKI